MHQPKMTCLCPQHACQLAVASNACREICNSDYPVGIERQISLCVLIVKGDRAAIRQCKLRACILHLGRHSREGSKDGLHVTVCQKRQNVVL